MAEPLYQRDIGGKTGQDKLDIASMPKVRLNYQGAKSSPYHHLRADDGLISHAPVGLTKAWVFFRQDESSKVDSLSRQRHYASGTFCLSPRPFVLRIAQLL